METPEERLKKIRETAPERAKQVDNVLDATRLALQSARVEGFAPHGRPVMRAMTVYEIRLKVADMGLAYDQPEIARAAEELVRRGEARIVHEEKVPSYQWWPQSNEEVA